MCIRDSTVRAQEEFEPGIGRVAAPPIEIGVFNHDRPTRSSGVPHSAEQFHGTCEMLEEEAAVYDVICAGIAPLVDVEWLEVDVADVPCGGSLSSQFEFDVVHVDANGEAAGFHQAGDLERDFSTAAAQVDTTHTGCKSDSLKKGGRIRPSVLSKELKAIVSRLPPRMT